MAHNSIVLLLLLELQCSVLQCCLWNPEGHGFCCTFWMSVTALTRIRVDSESGAECVRLARLDSQLRTMLLITAAAAAASTPHRVGSDTSNQQSVVANANNAPHVSCPLLRVHVQQPRVVPSAAPTPPASAASPTTEWERTRCPTGRWRVDGLMEIGLTCHTLK